MTGSGGHRRLAVAGKALYVAATLLLMGMAGLLALRFAGPAAHAPWGLLLVSAAIYLVGHLLRIARLALLNADARLSMRALASVHLFTAAVSLAAPFKIGEVYRVAELSNLTGDALRGVILVWLERVFDVAIILMLLAAVALTYPQAVQSFLGVLALSVGFVVATALLLVLLPDNLRRVGSYIMRRHDGEWSVGALWMISEARGMVGRMSRMLRGRIVSLLVVSLMIWGLEGLSFGLIASSRHGMLQPVSGLLSFLSLTTEGETLLTILRRTDGIRLPVELMVYALVTQGALLLAGLVAGVASAPRRLLSKRFGRG